MTRSLIVGVHDTGDSRNALVRATEWTRGRPLSGPALTWSGTHK